MAHQRMPRDQRSCARSTIKNTDGDKSVSGISPGTLILLSYVLASMILVMGAAEALGESTNPLPEDEEDMFHPSMNLLLYGKRNLPATSFGENFKPQADFYGGSESRIEKLINLVYYI
ncbi:hypothetical protein HELRODRAFT_171626 [Helobdella robusta]|uniref:Uncharacterized protein n=1 Tax=Helobdella robusta TaxID=6412 RepID=T1F4H1_HELRO|nr:hypothetical protein HELRODRAFT_171626 [Helobdella robusta]ESO05265.1 hypothetical protein HELRODRAFT_171626 [Helobdella robusta]